MLYPPPPPLEILRDRRNQLAAKFLHPVLLWSGQNLARNFPANTYPFRASSHFLYFAGLPLRSVVIHLQAGQLRLFMDEASPGAALWHGESPTREEVGACLGAEAAYPLADLPVWSADCATIALPDAHSRSQQAKLLQRPLPAADQAEGIDAGLTAAIVVLRLTHDEAAVVEMRRAIAVSIAAHRTGMAVTQQAPNEAAIRAAMEAVIVSQGMTTAYSSIVTVHGDVLHNDCYHHEVRPGDLLLADVGAEAATGWASDLTRTWPVAGKFSPTQRAIYDLVLAAHDACIAAMQPGVEYRDIHLLAAHVIAAGLVELGLLRGNPADLVDRDAHALFFPHGIGHLLGLDVHDMEDLGDRAGYASGRCRSDRFGLGYLRLDRPLQPGMVVTIEPGFYQVPAILQDPNRRQQYQDVVNWERLTDFADVRGIRIEDDVLVTEMGAEVLSKELPTAAEAIEAIVAGSDAA
jgi:Xaa-Pro aminopeptidase